MGWDETYTSRTTWLFSASFFLAASSAVFWFTFKRASRCPITLFTYVCQFVLSISAIDIEGSLTAPNLRVFLAVPMISVDYL